VQPPRMVMIVAVKHLVNAVMGDDRRESACHAGRLCRRRDSKWRQH
jgi:hypothetical protein